MYSPVAGKNLQTEKSALRGPGTSLRHAIPVASGIHLGPQCSLVRLYLGVRRMHLEGTDLAPHWDQEVSDGDRSTNGVRATRHLLHPKQMRMCAKTFGREITTLEEMQEAIATYTARAAEKLREQDSFTSCLTIFIRTNSFNRNREQYANSFTVTIPYPTPFTPDLIKYALAGLKAIYREGYRYKKCGVSLAQIVPEDALQPDLFGEFSLQQHQRQARFMAIVDAINRIYGRDTLVVATQGITRSWKMRQLRLSPRLTTRWSEIVSVT